MGQEFSSQGERAFDEAVVKMVWGGEDLYESKELKEETLPVIIFRLSREWYGVAMTKIIEILKKPKITYLPSSPAYIAGIMNLRGNILSVTDLKGMLGLSRDEANDGTKIVAVENGLLKTGLLVDEVVESIELPVSKIESVPSSFPSDKGKYLEGLFRWDNKLVALINIERVLGEEI